jgi:hypothetical protein
MWLSKFRLRRGGIPLQCAVLLSLQGPIHGAAQSAETFSNIDFALRAIRQTFNASTGFEPALGDLDKSPVSLDASGDSVTRVFDALVAQRPN